MTIRQSSTHPFSTITIPTTLATLIDVILQGSFVGRFELGYRPLPARGLVLGAGYQYLALRGDTTSASVFTDNIEGELAADFDGAEGELDVVVTPHMLTARLGYEWEIQQRFVVMGGSCKLTLARGLVEQVDGRTQVRFDSDKIRNRRDGIDYERLMYEPGDGTVTKASLLARQSLDPTVARHRYSYFPLGHAVFLCEDHSMLTGNLSFQDNLLNALLSAD